MSGSFPRECVLLIATRLSGAEPATADAAAITFTAEDFHKELANDEPDRVMSLLLPDALIV